jgi:hypothetical protein
MKALAIRRYKATKWSFASRTSLERDIIAALKVPQKVRGSGYGVLATVNGAGDILSSSLVAVLWSVAAAHVALSCRDPVPDWNRAARVQTATSPGRRPDLVHKYGRFIR